MKSSASGGLWCTRAAGCRIFISSPASSIPLSTILYSSPFISPTALVMPKKPSGWRLFSGIFLGLAVLTKRAGGHSDLRTCARGVLGLTTSSASTSAWPHLLVIAGCAIATTAAVVRLRDSQPMAWWFVEEFVKYQWRLFSTPDAGHDQPFFYHPLVLLIGCFPASLFLFSYFTTARARSIYLSQPAEGRICGYGCGCCSG